MELNITYDAQSVLDQLPRLDRERAQATIDEVHSELNEGGYPPKLMTVAGVGQSSQVYMARAGSRWRIYFKVMKDKLFVVDVVPAKQLETLRKPSN